MSNLKQKWSQLKKWQKAVIILLIIGLFGSLLPKQPEPKKLSWKEMDSTQKSEWIANIKDNMESDNIYDVIHNRIENQLQYPEEADFNVFSGLSNPILVKEGEPVFIFTDDGISKNGFGVKVRFTWMAEVEIKPERSLVLSVIVTNK